MVILCAALVLLVGMSALVIDTGRFYTINRHLSNVADAAALAGAQELSLGASPAKNMALKYAAKNGVSGDQVEVQAIPHEGIITVEAREKVPYWFGSLLVKTDFLELKQKATAAYGNPKASQGVAPLGIEDHDFVFGKKYVLKVASNDEYETGLGVGNFGALALGGSGAHSYENNLTEGYDGKVGIGDVVITESGNMSQPTRRAIDARVDRAISHSYTENKPGCSRILVVPVFKPYHTTPNQVVSIKVMGFASFWVEAVQGQGNESRITGYFIESTTSGYICTTAPDYGLSGVRLIH